MPSSKNYVRNYDEEWKDAKARGVHKDDATRHRARYAAVKAGKVTKGDGKEVHHVKAIGNGGGNAASNLKVTTKSANRSFARNKDGSMKSETSKRERRKK